MSEEGPPRLEPGSPEGRTPPTSLPVITLDPLERKSQAEKYGSFRYLAIAGLALLIGMIGWFAWGVWSLRDVWRDVYVLHDPSRPEAERLDAAYRLSRDPDATERQLYDISLRRELPDAARYLAAEALSAEAMTGDPRGYAFAVARSEGWPDWLRLLHLRPLAYGAGRGEAIYQEPLRELAEHDDPIIRLWALYILAESSRYNSGPREALDDARRGPFDELASLLWHAIDAEDDARRVSLLDEATDWVRAHHPGAEGIWSRWTRRGGGFVRVEDGRPNSGTTEAGKAARSVPR